MELATENHTSTMENPPSPFRIPSMPGTPQPLQPISSERQNQQRVPQSPSVSLYVDGSGSPRKSQQHRASDAADVKARIAYLNAVSQSGSPPKSNSPNKPQMATLSHAAIQRAVLGREEAESALGALTAQLDSAKARERLVSERVESLMEQLTEARNRQRHERSVYEKEIKQSKKTEYKAELAVIKLQEDLRETRSELEAYKARSEHDKVEKEKARQEAFERAYVVAGMTEEIQDLRQRLEVTEQERDSAVATAASRMAMKEETLVQKGHQEEQEVGEKRKQPTSDFDIAFYDEMDLEAPDCPIEIKYAEIQRHVELLKDKIKEDQETIHFMNMQCQFKACACRLAERDGVRFVHDYEYDAKVRARNAKKRKVGEVEPQLPLPVFKSWRQKQEEVKGKQPVRGDVVGCAIEYEEISSARQPEHEQIPEENAIHHEEAIVAAPPAPLPPSNMVADIHEGPEQSATFEEAMNIPLPSLKPMEIDSSDETPEPTAQLEEMTQVIVEPVSSSQNFLFSTSTTSMKAVPEPLLSLQQPHGVRMSDDLFDISPPKRHMPPRPSTAMGVLTVDSPIRLAQHSPDRWTNRSMTPDIDLPQSMTTRIALNDTSPVKQARKQRNQPGLNHQDRTRGRSPAPQRVHEHDRSSPAPSTLFPIAPATKHERANQHHIHVQPRPHSTQDHYAKELSTTTTVPLRDGSEQPASMVSNSGENSSASSRTPFVVPGTPNMTREQALAQIRARRDRARSVNMRKSADDGNKTPGSAARRGVNLKDRLGDVKGRDFSQASAPGRI